MNTRNGFEGHDYESFYGEFDSPLMRRLRLDAYGEDIGQHSWVTAGELREDIPRLCLSPSSRLLDLGCGPCGPLTFVIAAACCSGAGIDMSPAALRVGGARAASLGLESVITLHKADLNEPLEFTTGSFDAVLSLDVVLHVRDRLRLFREIARILIPGGRFLFTDAGVVTGSISDEEREARSLHGYTQFVAPGFNERVLQAAGFRLIEAEDRTAGMFKVATARLAARLDHRAELDTLTGAADFEMQRRYLETVIELSQRRALSRMIYLVAAAAA